MFDKINERKWWDFGWKLVEGCTPVSPACKNCWSIAMEKRFRKETGIVFHEERLERPLKRKKPASYAIWNDLFHEKISHADIHETLSIIQKCPQHIFMVLTKRPDNALKFFEHLENVMKNGVCGINFLPIENIWLGVTVENKNNIWRIEKLLQIPAKVKFISYEPALEEIDITDYYEYYDCSICNGTGSIPIDDGGKACPNCLESSNGLGKLIKSKIDWIIAGPETGPGKRSMKKEWIESLYKQCKIANVPFFDKKDILGLNIRQFPEI